MVWRWHWVINFADYVILFKFVNSEFYSSFLFFAASFHELRKKAAKIAAFLRLNVQDVIKRLCMDEANERLSIHGNFMKGNL